MCVIGLVALGLAIDGIPAVSSSSSASGDMWLNLTVSLVLAVEGVALLVSGGQQLWRLRGASPGEPLVSCEAGLESTLPQDELAQKCISAMLSIKALNASGSSSILTDGKCVTIHGGTRAWATRGRGSRISIVVDQADGEHNGSPISRVQISSGCYRAQILDTFKVRRNVRNIFNQLLG
jgi:hypothetical protein